MSEDGTAGAPTHVVTDSGRLFAVGRRLAMGGMAEVYLAIPRDAPSPSPPVVLKRILPRLSADVEFVRMFEDEAVLASKLDHPNIVTVLDLGLRARDPFFVMEYVHGAHLRSVLRVSAGLSLGVALEITVTLAEALHYAHERCDAVGQSLGVVHRDVSPTNVIVTYDGVVKLLDFGIAKLSAGVHVTRAGTLKGKTAYMSPEQCRSEPLDRRSDVYALGILLFELTTGTRLFRGEHEIEIFQQVQQGKVERPSSRCAGYPAALEALLMQALAPKPSERFSTAAAFAHALRSLAPELGERVDQGQLRQTMQEMFGHPPLPDWQGPDISPEDPTASSLVHTGMAPPRRRGSRPGIHAARTRPETPHLSPPSPAPMASPAASAPPQIEARPPRPQPMGSSARAPRGTVPAPSRPRPRPLPAPTVMAQPLPPIEPLPELPPVESPTSGASASSVQSPSQWHPATGVASVQDPSLLSAGAGPPTAWAPPPAALWHPEPPSPGQPSPAHGAATSGEKPRTQFLSSGGHAAVHAPPPDSAANVGHAPSPDPAASADHAPRSAMPPSQAAAHSAPWSSPAAPGPSYAPYPPAPGSSPHPPHPALSGPSYASYPPTPGASPHPPHPALPGPSYAPYSPAPGSPPHPPHPALPGPSYASYPPPSGPSYAPPGYVHAPPVPASQGTPPPHAPWGSASSVSSASMHDTAPRPRRGWSWLLVLAILLLMAGGAWLGWSWFATGALPFEAFRSEARVSKDLPC